MAYDRQPLAFLVDLCSFYTAFEVEKVKTVNLIFGLYAICYSFLIIEDKILFKITWQSVLL